MPTKTTTFLKENNKARCSRLSHCPAAAQCSPLFPKGVPVAVYYPFELQAVDHDSVSLCRVPSIVSCFSSCFFLRHLCLDLLLTARLDVTTFHSCYYLICVLQFANLSHDIQRLCPAFLIHTTFELWFSRVSRCSLTRSTRPDTITTFSSCSRVWSSAIAFSQSFTSYNTPCTSDTRLETS